RHGPERAHEPPSSQTRSPTQSLAFRAPQLDFSGSARVSGGGAPIVLSTRCATHAHVALTSLSGLSRTSALAMRRARDRSRRSDDQLSGPPLLPRVTSAYLLPTIPSPRRPRDPRRLGAVPSRRRRCHR